MSRLSPTVLATCREYFGRNVTRADGSRHLVNNRCGKCPLRTPCLEWGSAPARTLEELDESAAVFNAAAARGGA